jgi:glycosyltransferase involved in cell wall biosynthesis
MAHGKVVICTKLIGICEFTQDDENIITVRPNDIPAIVSAIQGLLNDPEKYKKIAANAHTLGATMSWEHQVSRIIQIYNQLTM